MVDDLVRLHLGVLQGPAQSAVTAGRCSAQLSTISVFYKQRNNFFFPVTSYALPTVLLRVPLSVVTGIIYTALTYFVVGFAPDVGRCACLSE